MIFKHSINYDAYYFPFNWGAEYVDGTYLTEFDLHNHEKNDFYDIDQPNLNRFGLFGCGMKFYYNMDGSFNLAGQHIEIEYHLEDKIYYLTTAFEKKDCITYKQNELVFNPDINLQFDEMISIDFGYKTLLNYDGTQFFFQPIVKLPVNKEDGKVEIEVKITSNLDLDGQIVFKNKGKIMDSSDCPLIRNHSTTVNWTVR